MTEAELNRWAEEQIAALVGAGIDLLDAQRTVERVLARLPVGEDPRTYIPPTGTGPVEITQADVDDARADWYASDAVEPKYKRLLDAREEGEDE